MRYIKPIRGFRFSRNLVLLLLSTAVFSGQFMVGNKAYGLEAPIMPPSFMMTSAKNVETESDVSSKAKVETKKEVKKEIKDAKVVVEKSKNASEKLADSPNQNNVIKKEVKNIPSEDKKDKDLQNSDNQKGLSTSELGLPEINLSNSEEDFSISKAEIKPEAKAEPKNEPKPEAKPAKNLIASAKIIEPENLSTPSSKDS
ncbi:MAG: hypothetical protein J6Z11_06460, partial [Candidatus Riflebacteria bacterium]|nr:hypothetical protein [Candidatus Riflebacteria bacterium]